MLIVNDLYRFLEDEGVLDEYIENCDEDVKEVYKLSDGFEWEYSPEGQGFWEKMDSEYDKRRKGTTKFFVEV